MKSTVKYGIYTVLGIIAFICFGIFTWIKVSIAICTPWLIGMGLVKWAAVLASLFICGWFTFIVYYIVFLIILFVLAIWLD